MQRQKNSKAKKYKGKKIPRQQWQGNSKAMKTVQPIRSGVEITMMIVVTEIVNTDVTPHNSFNSCVIEESLTKCL